MSLRDSYSPADALYEVHMLRMRIVAFVIGFAAATFLMVAASRAMAAEARVGQLVPPVLKEKVLVSSDVITLGDLFENAGSTSSRPVFRSPDPGKRGMISAPRLRQVAERHGLFWPNFGGVEKVSVLRTSRLISVEDQEKLVRAALITKVEGADVNLLEVKFTSRGEPIHLDTSVQTRVTTKSLNYNKKSGSFRAVLGFEDGVPLHPDWVVRGRAHKVAQIYVPARPLTTGTIITKDDLEMRRLPATKIRASFAKSLNEIVGKAAKKPISAERPIRRSDLEKPQLVKKNSLVDIMYERAGLSLKVEGRTVDSGALHDTVKVVNTHSRKTIIATVVGPDRVSVTGPLRAQRPRRVTRRPRKVSYKQERKIIRDGWKAVSSYQ